MGAAMTKQDGSRQSEQKARFIETAERIGADDPDALDRALGKIVPPVLPETPPYPNQDASPSGDQPRKK